MTNRKKLASTWIMAQKIGVDNPGYEKCSWAADELINMADSDPKELWYLILEILHLDSSEKIIKSVGAGPLEDLIVEDDKNYIEKIEIEASKSDSFRSAMRYVWLDQNDTTLYKKFYDIAGIKAPFEK